MCVSAPTSSDATTACQGAAGTPAQVKLPRRGEISAINGCLSSKWNSTYAARPAGRQNQNRPAALWLASRLTRGTKYQRSGDTLPIASAEGTAKQPMSRASGSTAAGCAKG